MMTERRVIQRVLYVMFFILFVAGTAAASKDSGNYLNPGLLASINDLKGDLIIIDARHPDKYKAGHIPHSVSLWWKDCGFPDLNKISMLENLLGKKGIEKSKKIIVYDEGRFSKGYAGRIFWMLEYLGCSNVKILNGGWFKWVKSKKPVDRKKVLLKNVKFRAKVNSNIIADKRSVKRSITNDDTILIDTRTDEEFNGWALNGEKRGGHIKNAVFVAHDWLFNGDGTIRDSKSLKELMELSGIRKNSKVIFYGSFGVRSGTTYFVLRLMGHSKCSNYDGSLYKWSRDKKLPVEAMPRYEKLVNAAWVDKLIKKGKPGVKGMPKTYPLKDYVIVHASSLYWKGAANPKGYDPHGDYTTGHIPQAISIPLNRFDTKGEMGIYPWTKPEDGNILPPDQLKKIIESYGIRHDMTVVVYCGDKSYVGGAYRVAWVLMYAGVKDVRYLNGDLAAWVRNGGKLETKVNTPVPVSDFGVKVPVHPEYLATNETIEKMINDKNSVIADDRSHVEYYAKDRKGCLYDFFCVPGHVPGAVWVKNMYWYTDSYNCWRKPGYYKPASLKSYNIIKNEWEKLGVTKDKTIAFYCGGGWRSSLVWYYAYLLGYPNIKNYDGGWYDWTWNPKRAVSFSK